MPRDYRDAVIETLADRELSLEQTAATYRLMLTQALELLHQTHLRILALERSNDHLRDQLRAQRIERAS